VGKVCLISLGCPKNLVDSENLLKNLGTKGLSYTTDPESSDILLINTCGFIEDAKRESIDEILKLAQYKHSGKDRKLVVFGCLAKRFGDELRREIPEIDALWGVGEENEIASYCAQVAGKRELEISIERLTDTSYAYLKIAEGCSRGCSYCVIPDIRGSFRSRRPEDILREAEGHIQEGTKELILIAQDISSYGRDIGKLTLSRLIRDIAALPGDFWIRLLYLYPASVDDELIDTIASEDKVCKYLDIPLQHSEKSILDLMRRGGGRAEFEDLIHKIRRRMPDVAIRTTFIVGFPQETEEYYESLRDFIRHIKFDRLGVFTYSKEEGSAAYSLKGHLSERIKRRRRDEIMTMQSAISLEKNRHLVGKDFRALVDETDGGVSIARLYSQAPEIDGVVFITKGRAEKGSFVRVRITDAYDYDLKGEIIP
jgi:ribosomal protein S12 methylthiotransferase